MRWTFLLVLLWVTSAGAQFFSDDFESQTLLTTELPAGKWDRQQDFNPGDPFGIVPQAAHRGNFGLRLVDGSTGGGSRAGDAVFLDLPSLTGTVHVRFWLRLVEDNAAGAILFASVNADPISLGIAEAYHEGQGPTLSLGGRNFATDFEGTTSSRGLQAQRWHLIEVVLINVGGANGSRELWVDGTRVLTTSNVDWTGLSLNGMGLGQTWGEEVWEGTLDFDDVRIGTTSPASRLRLSSPSLTPTAFSCIPVDVELLEGTSDQLAPAPELLTLTLLASAGAGSFHLDAGCAGAATTELPLPLASVSERVYFRPTLVGTLTLEASHLDLLPGSVGLNVAPSTPDGSTPSPQPQFLRVGCGCSAQGPQDLLLWLCLPTLFQTRRRVRARTMPAVRTLAPPPD